MRGRGATWGLSLVAACALGSCGDDPTIVSARHWGAEFAAAECARIFSCCEATEAERVHYTDEAACRQMLATDQQEGLDGLLRYGQAIYDAKAARRCVDEIATLSCAELLPFGYALFAPSCYAVTRGARPIGAPCEDLDGICQSSNCLADTGLCGPTRGCSTICGAEEYCDATAQACAPLKGAGAACAATSECAVPLGCLSTTGTCETLLPGGVACTARSDCASNVCTTDAVCYAKECDGV